MSHSLYLYRRGELGRPSFSALLHAHPLRLYKSIATVQFRIIPHDGGYIVRQLRLAKDPRHPRVQLGHFAHHHCHKHPMMLTSVYSVYRVAHSRH